MEEADLLLEEYRVVAAEKNLQYRNRDTASVLALTVGATIIGYAIETKQPSALYFAGPLFLFLVLYVQYVTRVRLALKADAYLRVYLEPRMPPLGWYERKSGYHIGPIWYVNRLMITLLYAGLVAGSYFFYHQTAEYAWVLGVPAACLFVFATVQLWRSSDYFLRRWETRLEAEGLLSSPIPKHPARLESY